MSRCRCCDNVLNDRELQAKNKHTGLPEDFCYTCRAISMGIPVELADEIEAFDALVSHRYSLGHSGYVHLEDK